MKLSLLVITGFFTLNISKEEVQGMVFPGKKSTTPTVCFAAAIPGKKGVNASCVVSNLFTESVQQCSATVM